ncbi:hypothetical protein [Paenibacillus sp. MER 99-2]|uniref:hypothetical protein n=1 Tax=Paenibacillus sp. MER 99-2 TaxID=2939572 RepID=UPI00203FFA44|nr:hypothetical protein [Paenibacillus sp. MER 99-2]MCM3174738.1 hypothetical protein [Paenibacillus sp. MER 99-2]
MLFVSFTYQLNWFYFFLFDNLPKAMRLADRTLIFDNSKVYKVQAEVDRGQTRYQSEDMSPWVKKAMKNWNPNLDEVRKDLQ